MNRIRKAAYLVAGLVPVVFAAGSAHSTGFGNDLYDVGEVREATGAFHNIPLAQAGGYALIPGLDGCFDNPGVDGMTLHLETDLGVYVLHAWIWYDNPAGFFRDWNPRINQCVETSRRP